MRAKGVYRNGKVNIYERVNGLEEGDRIIVYIHKEATERQHRMLHAYLVSFCDSKGYDIDGLKNEISYEGGLSKEEDLIRVGGGGMLKAMRRVSFSFMKNSKAKMSKIITASEDYITKHGGDSILVHRMEEIKNRFINSGQSKYSEMKTYLAACQDFKCAICDGKRASLESGADMHHAYLHNKQGHAKDYPYFIHSMCNLFLVCKPCHNEDGGWRPEGWSWEGIKKMEEMFGEDDQLRLFATKLIGLKERAEKEIWRRYEKNKIFSYFFRMKSIFNDYFRK